MPGQGAGDGPVRGDEDGARVEADRVDDGGGVGLAAAGGDDDLDAGGLGVAQDATGAVGDAAANGGQEGPVYIDGDQPHR